MSNNEINLRDFTWESELHEFKPKDNSHANVKKMKQREAEKKINSGNRKNKKEPVIVDRKMALDKKSLEIDLQDHIDELREN